MIGKCRLGDRDWLKSEERKKGRSKAKDSRCMVAGNARQNLLRQRST